ncbi:hypothetical protein L6452_42232 [Arctium lappa]|uniref:Uncharacterized protein n=1 Tax=Arctium lappa TaxID=4217 RepID=A0ACB8XH49_ARCLA|nr:hypothetical protein L6452_42232 [Arctium lappa]
MSICRGKEQGTSENVNKAGTSCKDFDFATKPTYVKSTSVTVLKIDERPPSEILMKKVVEDIKATSLNEDQARARHSSKHMMDQEERRKKMRILCERYDIRFESSENAEFAEPSDNINAHQGEHSSRELILSKKMDEEMGVDIELIQTPVSQF